MPMQANPLGAQLSLFDLSKGCNFMTTGHKAQSGIVRVVNLRNAPSASLELETPYASIDMPPDPDTGGSFAERILLVFQHQRMLSSPVVFIVTATRLMRHYRAGNALEVVYTWPEPIEAASAVTWNSRAYFATGKNYLVETSGHADGTRTVSDKWDEGYRYPSCITAYQALLIASGFSGQGISTEASEIRATDTDVATALLPYSTLLRTEDADSVTAIAAAPWGLVVWKRSSQFVVTGSDFQMFTDVTIRRQTPEVGCVGPNAWAMDDSGAIFFKGPHGVYVLANPVDPAVEVSLPISPAFMSREGTAPFGYPLVSPNNPAAQLAYDPIRHEIRCVFPVGAA